MGELRIDTLRQQPIECVHLDLVTVHTMPDGGKRKQQCTASRADQHAPEPAIGQPGQPVNPHGPRCHHAAQDARRRPPHRAHSHDANRGYRHQQHRHDRQRGIGARPRQQSHHQEHPAR
ncbi:hypothetical protein D3C75_1032640 [compost metagenome]